MPNTFKRFQGIIYLQVFYIQTLTLRKYVYWMVDITTIEASPYLSTAVIPLLPSIPMNNPKTLVTAEGYNYQNSSDKMLHD